VVQVGGPANLLASARRSGALAAACDLLGLGHSVIATDQTGGASAQATRRVLSSARRPGAIVYDNDAMAVAGLGVAMEMGVAVPAALSLVSWEDSPLCQVVRPPLTAVASDVTGYGRAAARLLLDVIDGLPARTARYPDAGLVVRASSGPV
jgi:DNA-binding LacI/PurR family transcriptional regulator